MEKSDAIQELRQIADYQCLAIVELSEAFILLTEAIRLKQYKYIVPAIEAVERALAIVATKSELIPITR